MKEAASNRTIPSIQLIQRIKKFILFLASLDSINYYNSN